MRNSFWDRRSGEPSPSGQMMDQRNQTSPEADGSSRETAANLIRRLGRFHSDEIKTHSLQSFNTTDNINGYEEEVLEQTGGLHVEDVHVVPRGERVVQKHLHQLGGGRLAGQQLALSEHAGERLLNTRVGRLGPGFHLHLRVQRSWIQTQGGVRDGPQGQITSTRGVSNFQKSIKDAIPIFIKLSYNINSELFPLPWVITSRPRPSDLGPILPQQRRELNHHHSSLTQLSFSLTSNYVWVSSDRAM